MHDHRTGPSGPDDSSPRDDDRRAAEFMAAFEGWLADPDSAPPPMEEPKPDAIAQDAWARVAKAFEEALSLPGLRDHDAVELARLYDRAARMAHVEPVEHLAARRWTPAQHERIAWYAEHGHIAAEPGGIMVWNAIPMDLRTILYGAGILTVEHLRTHAKTSSLTTIHGIGPARERTLRAALRRVS